ncbi:24696_t:CDS:1, partial [Racocetra persica]
CHATKTETGSNKVPVFRVAVCGGVRQLGGEEPLPTLVYW